jgi:hypothetical protein
MFEAMTPEGRLSVIQKKRLCQFCLRHPDTQTCPSHSQPACPIRGCMRMHHRMLHRALLREEARPVVLGVARDAGGHHPEENPLTSDSEDSALVTSDEDEGGEPEKARLCMQMVPVEAANGAVQGLHTLYDWGSTVTLVRRESARIQAGVGGAKDHEWFRGSRSPSHRMSLPSADRRKRETPGDLRLRSGGDHRGGRNEVASLG